MFVLSHADLGLRILSCADGPASFNAESTRRGTAVVSMDPLYRLDTTTIRARIAATYDQILEQVRRNRQQFVWDTIQSVRNWAVYGKPCKNSSMTTMRESGKDAMLPPNSRPSPSLTNHST